MRYLTRCKERITWIQPERFAADLNKELAVNNIKALVLVKVQVSWWATLVVKGVLKNEEAAAVLARNFEVDTANTQPPMFAELVFPCWDLYDRWNISRSLWCLSHGALLMVLWL